MSTEILLFQFDGASMGISELPNLEKNMTLMGEILRENPFLYKQLAIRNSETGETFDQVIQVGMDYPKEGVGAMLGDEHTYTTFKEFFERLVEAKHGK